MPQPYEDDESRIVRSEAAGNSRKFERRVAKNDATNEIAANGEDEARMREILDAVDRSDDERDDNRIADLWERLDRNDDSDAIRLVIELLALLLARANGGLGREQPGLENSVKEGDAIVIPEGATVRLLSQNARYLEDGALRPEPIIEERGEERSVRKTRLVSQLRSGSSFGSLMSREERVIEESDRIIDASKSGAATRDTAERKREEAKRNMHALQEIQAERQTFVQNLNRSYDFRELRSKAHNRDAVRQLAEGEFVLDECLNVVLKGIDASFLPNVRAHFTNETMLDAGDGSVALRNPQWSIIFRRGSDGTLVLEQWHGREWQPPSLQ